MLRSLYVYVGVTFYICLFVIYQVVAFRAAQSFEDNRHHIYAPTSNEDYNVDKFLIIEPEENEGNE